ncbi:MAG: ExbD/TolR family protein, partial [Algiphilus sp.]
MSDALRENPKAEEDNAIDLTPMLDVVFIMLIFFIVTATFVKEAGIEVERPLATTAERQDLANILIAITPDDDIWIDGKPVDARDLTTRISRLHAENPQGSVVI